MYSDLPELYWDATIHNYPRCPGDIWLWMTFTYYQTQWLLRYYLEVV